MSVVLNPLDGVYWTDDIDDVMFLVCVSEVLRDGVIMFPNKNRRSFEEKKLRFTGDDAEVFMLFLSSHYNW